MTREQILDAYNAKLKRIQNNRVYSDHAKQVMAAKAYKEAQDALDQLRDNTIAQLRTRRADLQRRMFGYADSNDPNALLARRNATDRANQLDDPRTAADELRHALDQGDSILARAIAKRAADYGWGDVLDAYADTRPDFRRLAEEYNTTPDPDDKHWAVTHAFNHVAPPPASLITLQAHEIDRLAQQDLDGPASGTTPTMNAADVAAVNALFRGGAA